MCRNHEKSSKPGLDKNSKHVNQKRDSKVVNDRAIMINHPNVTQRKSMIPSKVTNQPLKTEPQKSIPNVRKSMIHTSRSNTSRQSVFERLYQPKTTHRTVLNETEKLKTNPNHLKQVIKNTGIILNKRHTCFEPNKMRLPVRRSISAVHFKRISSNELKNCIHKWSSIGDNLNKVHLKEINEDASVKEDKIVSAIKSDRKKVKFSTSYNFNTPRPEELQLRLKNWLQKRGKSLDSYHHLQCFGIHHLAQQQLQPLNLEQEKFDPGFIEEDEDKENIPLESDTDNESYSEIMDGQVRIN